MLPLTRNLHCTTYSFHLRAQLAALAAQNDAAQQTRADLAARNAEAERVLENTVQAAAQHAQDHTTDRVVHADVAKRMVHAPTLKVDILLNLSKTVHPEVQIGIYIYLYWSTSATDILQGKRYGAEIESWLKAQVDPDDQYTYNLMSGFFAETPVIDSGPFRFQRFRSAIDFLQQFFKKRFTSFDVPTEIAAFLRSLKVKYGSDTRNYLQCTRSACAQGGTVP